MSHQKQNDWVVLSPPFSKRESARQVFIDHAKRLSQLQLRDEDTADIGATIEKSLKLLEEIEPATSLKAAIGVLTDLALQGWLIRVTNDGVINVKRPEERKLDLRLEKARIREQEILKRDEQLRQPATRKFVRGMEKQSLHGERFVSIYSLIRDGRELSESLRAARSLAQADRVSALQKVIDPYLQFVDDAEYCDQTGLRLQDIWRYFRHTWANQYTSTPGRFMAFLVRDRAKEFHPVIGIGSLGSPIVQIRERDIWLGWHPDAFMEFVSDSPKTEIGVWLNKTVETALSEIYLDDFIEEQLITPADLRRPSVDLLARLTTFGDEQRELHQRFTRAQDLKKFNKRNDEEEYAATHWTGRSKSHLYRSKRAFSLVDMLHSRMILQKYLSSLPTVDEIKRLICSSEGCRTVKKVLRKAKADRVGIAMADITVCGAVAPYNSILGGKLVSMLSASPEVIAAYRDKYFEQQSEIASSMAGRPIVRPSQLVFLGTTSLYGAGSSQYNRLWMPAERIGGKAGERLSYIEIGKSEAFGTSHFSSNTVESLVALMQQSSNGQRVNSIFGEGTSPKLRKIRDGLDALNFPSDTLLQHGRHRIVYGIPLVRNLREFLLGFDNEPEYIFDLTDPAAGTAEIARWWTERWLSKRIMSDDVLACTEQHTLVRPIRHGARVVLPPVDEGEIHLFDDLTN